MLHREYPNYIANYEIGHDTFIENVDIILVDGLSRFGNSVEVSVLNETGGREVLISDKLLPIRPISWRCTVTVRN